MRTGRRLRFAASLAVAVLLGCRHQAAPPAAPGPPSPRATRGYILISIDTLRADHLGCYGYPRPTSPFLDRLAQRATVFDEAYAQFPSTLVSHMSMFTGLYPRQHGVLPPDRILPETVETMPEVFQRGGFRTAGFTEGGFVSGRYGFRRGFDVWESRDRNRNRLLERTFGRGVGFLESLKPEDRFFLFLHTYAVHTPYDAPPEYRQPFWKGEPPAGAIAPTGPALIRQEMTGERPPQPVLDWLEALYDAGIRQTDEVLQRFFADLERLGLARDTTVLITSDHGEEFLDHGLFNHTQVYRESLHVPLLIVHPDRPTAVRQAGVVQLVDLAPTLYALAGLTPRQRPSGVSLAARIGRPSPPTPGTAWGEAFSGMRALYRGAHDRLSSVLVFDPPPGTWFIRRVSFDDAARDLAFQARSFREPRQLTVRQGENVLARVTLKPEWTPIQLALPGPGRVRLEADGCAPLESDAHADPRCQSFQIQGLRLARTELYDVARDPQQTLDLARQRAVVARAMLRDLLAFQPAPVAAATARPLDAELEKNLRSLGYLQ